VLCDLRLPDALAVTSGQSSQPEAGTIGGPLRHTTARLSESPSMLPESSLLLAFIGASLVLALTPGPAVVYIIARTLSQGRGCGLASVLGVALGNLANALGAAIGLAALFAVSSTAFTVVKWAGALYLVYLGVRMLRAPQAQAASSTEAVRGQSLGRVFRDGFLVALLNPKTSLFFAAFLPQFMDAQASPLLQTASLGAVFVGIACCTDLIYVFTASLVAPRLGKAVRHAVWGNRVAGASFIGLGVLTALGDRPVQR
jgi:threonine/homoserine/homoserine lactone efflux protein